MIPIEDHNLLSKPENLFKKRKGIPLIIVLNVYIYIYKTGTLGANWNLDTLPGNQRTFFVDFCPRWTVSKGRLLSTEGEITERWTDRELQGNTVYFYIKFIFKSIINKNTAIIKCKGKYRKIEIEKQQISQCMCIWSLKTHSYMCIFNPTVFKLIYLIFKI